MARTAVSAEQIQVWISRSLNQNPLVVDRGAYIKVPTPQWCDAGMHECNWGISYWGNIAGFEEVVVSALHEAQFMFRLVVAPQEDGLRIYG
ncbi:hypothetical protein [Jeongeupia naejangsanensis]|uniref:Uncharacterized protein n=1 Tax=Jeongeupia naejangsanensis TaxID=613195 RepID=A0ABS2BHK0_9NEIS|nr:hypothetical protein [Jeongeupia naejangsanensis]MBM3114925.1 hypothetical protein [Jeongeupia naejangsanensis]